MERVDRLEVVMRWSFGMCLVVLWIGGEPGVGRRTASGQEQRPPVLQVEPREEPSEVNTSKPAEALRGFNEYCWYQFTRLNRAVQRQNVGLKAGRTISVLVDQDHLAVPGKEVPVWMTWPTREDLDSNDLENWDHYAEKYFPTRAIGESSVAAPQMMDRLAKIGIVSSLAVGRPASELSDINQAKDAPGEFVGPLVAQNRYYVRYEIRFNRVAFEFIKRNKLHKKEYQPSNGQVPIGFPAGSIIVKAAWRVIVGGPSPDAVAGGSMSVAEDIARADRAFKQRCYFTQAKLNIRGKPKAEPVAGEARDAPRQEPGEIMEVGLVGLHLIHRTPSRPQWIWSSFEHVDNVPEYAQEPEEGKDYSFNYGKRRQGRNFPFNVDPNPLLSQATIPAVRTPDQLLGEGTLPIPVQVRRERPIPEATIQSNETWRKKTQGVANTAWANYELVVTQFPTRPDDIDADSPGDPFPGPDGLVDQVEAMPAAPPGKSTVEVHKKMRVSIGNTTMETYFQSDSCMSCHSKANRYGIAFVFSLGRIANPAPPGKPAHRAVALETMALDSPLRAAAVQAESTRGLEILETIRNDQSALGDILERVSTIPSQAQPAAPAHGVMRPMEALMHVADARARPAANADAGATPDEVADFAQVRQIFDGLIAGWIKKNGGECPPEMVKRHGASFGWTDNPWQTWAQLEKARFRDGPPLISEAQADTLAHVDGMLLIKVLSGPSEDLARNKQMPLNGPEITELDLRRLKAFIYNHYHPNAKVPVPSQ
jgi:hypothetical protein